MAISVRYDGSRVAAALVKAHNDSRRHTALVGALFHADATSQTTGLDGPNPVATTIAVAAANASSLGTSLTLCKELISLYRQHFADDTAHKVASTAALPAVTDPVDLATAITAANALKTAHGTHIASTTFHYNADATNTISAANATDQSSLNTLLNELKTDLIAHVGSAPQGSSVKLLPA